MLFALLFFIAHWYLTVFFQSFYLHRYISHRMFHLTPTWNRIFCLLTIITQGSSFLRPSLYRSLHLRHHYFSDTINDPHSPHHSKNIFNMMNTTLEQYLSLKNSKEDFPKMINFFDSIYTRLIFVAYYAFLYLNFTDSYWYLLLVPLHSTMGPIHGAIVNWFGHKNGYRNFKTEDQSTNTLKIDLLMLGELYQNNHHAFPQNANFASRSFEFDLTFSFIKFFKMMKVIN